MSQIIMKNYGLVSIIMPCYNNASVLAQAIESVINQSYTNWELLVINDCSKDNSCEVIQYYVAQDNRVRYFETDTPSGSPSLPRNIGIANSTGSYIAFLDSDDMWLPDKLEEQLLFMERHRYAFVYSNYEKITWNGERHNRIVKVKPSSSYGDILRSCSIPCLTVLLKKEIVASTRFRKTPKEDYVFWLEILKKGTIAFNTNKVQALYRESLKSRSGNKFKMIKEQWYVIRNIERVPLIQAGLFIGVYAIKGLAKYLR